MDDKNNPKPAKSLSEFFQQLYKNYKEPFHERTVKRKPERLSSSDPLTIENVKEKIKENRQLDQIAKEAEAYQKVQDELMRKEAQDISKEVSKKTPTNVVYDKSGKLVDLTGKPVKPKGGGKMGVIAGLALAGAGSLIPKDSWAGSTIEKVAEAADKADPSYWFNEGIVQGREEVDKLIEKIKHERILKELQDRAEQEDKIRKEKEALLKQDITPVVELLSGKPAIKPKEAEMMTGEVPSGEENIISVEDSDRKMRNKLGYR